ncbi:MAG: phage integrase N-terminal SAM-like domain-containing protein, partial [Bacteroidales bacterium]|nr:phage integrase N-terminal SAM-like domain-containing protein [Bacteroidales bacterium]
MITISKFTYKSKETKIKVHHPFERNVMVLLRKITGFSYSKTHSCWYIPYSIIAYKELKSYFPEVHIIEQNKREQKTLNLKNNELKTNYKNKITIIIDKEKNCFYVSQFYNIDVFNKLKELQYSFWQKQKKQWVFKGTNELFLKVKNILEKSNFEVIIENKKTIFELEKELKAKIFLEALKMKNYSINTIESYLPYFKEFVLNFKNQNIDNLTLTQLREYVADTINFKELSETQSKHLISAIKFYYEKILGKQKIYFFLTKKIEFTEEDLKISYTDLTPYLKQTTDFREKLIVLLHFSYNYKKNDLREILLEDLKSFLVNQNKTEHYSAIKEIIVKYYEKFTPQKYVFENNKEQYTEEEIGELIENIDNPQFAIIRYKNILQKVNFAEETQNNYLSGFKSFLKYFNFKHPKNITDIEIKKYLFDCKEKFKLSSSYINNQINTIKFYYTNVENRKIEYKYLFRPKREKRLPVVLSPNEVFEMINITENLKHKNIIALLYASGLRRAELLNLKINDIDFERDVIIIRKGKGNKDRQTLLSENFKILLQKYLAEYKPKEYLFEGATGGKYSSSSL